jgi:hypothetical protein
MVSERNKKQDIQTSTLSWLEQLAEEVNIPEAPLGWYTLSQITEKLNRDRNFVMRLLKEKNAQKQYYMMRKSDGKLTKLIHYKL